MIYPQTNQAGSKGQTYKDPRDETKETRDEAKESRDQMKEARDQVKGPRDWKKESHEQEKESCDCNKESRDKTKESRDHTKESRDEANTSPNQKIKLPLSFQLHNINIKVKTTSLSNTAKPSAFATALRKVVSPEGTVLLALVDEGFVEMAINFYLTCIKPYNIQNYLILTMHNKTCETLRSYSIKCFQYRDDINGSTEASNHGTKQFIDKMNVRTAMIIEALKLGYSVLHSDIDMTYMKNPFHYINCTKGECDMATLQDGDSLNAGFLLVHPSSLPVYNLMTYLSSAYPLVNDQIQLNLSAAMHQTLYPKFKQKRLSKREFLCGKLFYKSGRYFADTMPPCPECVVVHNNWIVGLAAKVYRAKEVHQWQYDGNQYYTNTKRKYLTYENIAKLNRFAQYDVLKIALNFTQALDRILILPKFYLGGKYERTLQSITNLNEFDGTYHGLYREHSFLTHPLVPETVKKSVRKVTHSKDVETLQALIQKCSRFTESILVLDINIVSELMNATRTNGA